MANRSRPATKPVSPAAAQLVTEALTALVDELENHDDMPQALVEAYEAGLYALKNAGVVRG